MPIFRQRAGQRQRIGGRLAEHRFERRGDSFQQGLVARIGVGVAHAELADLALVECWRRVPSADCGHRAAA